MKDFFGKEIQVGDWIIYGTLLGRCAAVKVGKIVSVNFVPSSNWRGGDQKIGVIGCEISHNWRTNERSYSLTKKGTLNFSERTVIIPESLVPGEIKKLYD